MRATAWLIILAFLLTGAGCSAATMDGSEYPGTAQFRTRSYLITFEELRARGQFSNLYDLVQALRPRWVQSQGPDTFMGTPGQVQVHFDGNRLGNVTVLRNLAVAGVTSIEWVAPIQASARFGLGHSHGAIVIRTNPVH